MIWCHLVIGDQNHTGGKVALQVAVGKPVDLASDAIVAANMDGCGGPPLGHG